MDMTHLLKEFPAAWTIFGVLIAGVIFYIANKNVFKWQADQIKQYKEISDASLKTLKEDRDHYRDLTHKLRTDMQAIVSENDRLKMMPDVKDLHDLMKEQSGAFKQIGDSMLHHMETTTNMFSTISKSLLELPKTLERMNRSIEAS